MKVEALNCPNCGAGVESDRSQCQFCRTRLKTVGCAKCFGLMFEGNTFCGHCGAIAAPTTVLADEEADCPRCRASMQRLEIGDTSLLSCAKCDGMWVDVVTFEHICAERERQAAVIGYLFDRTVHRETLTKVNYVPCPTCGQLMNRSNFAKSSGVVVDICKLHGVWFDADELPAIIEFIQKGGMELARQREKNELEEQRVKLRADQFQQALRESRMGASGTFDDEGAGIRRFVKILFD